MNTIPIDLIHEIFCRLPVKSIGRSRCVSEQWRSILCGRDFTELFVTRSSARPRLLFAMESMDSKEWLFYSSPQPHHRKCEKSSLAAHFQLKLRGDMRVHFCGRASGLLCFYQQNGEDRVHVICNPTTGQYELLPKVRTTKFTNCFYNYPVDKVLREITSRSFLGFDPIDKIFKVLSMSSWVSGHRILSLGTGRMSWSWRKIKCPLNHTPQSESEGICINGVLYYLAELDDHSTLIVCFNVRSEKFKFIHTGFIDEYMRTQLINYKDKLGVIDCETRQDLVRIWVLEDIEKQDWSEYAFTQPDDKSGDVSCIVFLKDYHDPVSFYFSYFHHERNTIQMVGMQGCDRGGFCVCVDYVDHLTFPMKPHQQQDRLMFENINKFDSLCLLDDV